jgi:hypothetical protein
MDEGGKSLKLALRKRECGHAAGSSVLNDVVNLTYCAPSKRTAVHERRSAVSAAAPFSMTGRADLLELTFRCGTLRIGRR